MVKEVSVADPPNYSGHNIIKFSILPGGFKKYDYDTKLTEEEFFLRARKLVRSSLWGNVAKVFIFVVLFFVFNQKYIKVVQ